MRSYTGSIATAALGVALAIAGFSYCSSNVALGIVGGVGGLLIVAGAVAGAIRKRRTQPR